MGDQNRAFTLFIKWMGFKSTAIDINHDERGSGKSSYTFKKQFHLALEIITTQSNKPLILSIKVGLSVALMSFLYALFIVVRYFTQGISVSGWASLIVSLYFVGGIILAQLGVLGLYIGYVFDQTKARPLYVVREVVENQKVRLGDK
jgi:dolichol-phosphate mannosyltransferase